MSTKTTDKPAALTPQQLLWQAREIARAHGLHIIEVQDKVGEHYFTEYVLYRNGVNGGPRTRLLKRRDPHDLLRELRWHAGVAEAKER